MSDSGRFTDNSKVSPGFSVVFVTTDFPSIDGLHRSQVLEPAAEMSRQGYDVSWIAAIPFLSYLRFLLLRNDGLRQFQDQCAKSGIRFHYLLTPITNGGLLSFPIRRLVLRWIAGRALGILKLQKDRKTIVHGRSYYATQLGLEIKSKAGREYFVRVSFDMRSVFPEEFPLTRGFVGHLLFGFAKQWEHELLRSADLSFLPLEYARDRIQKESGVPVTYAPIYGLDREADWRVDFARRWKNRHVGYAGSVGDWHDASLLLEMLRSVPDTSPKLATPAQARFAELDCRTYLHEEMADFYDSLLALVIPGRLANESYFVSFQMRCNLFSTKAAEALSRGVPLIVSSHLTELAEFVRQHQCGMVYDPIRHCMMDQDAESLRSKSTWAALTEGAAKVGAQFTRTHVLDRYVSAWSHAFEIMTESKSSLEADAP